MDERPYLVVSGILFGLVALLHLLRVVNGWSFEIGPLSLPLWVSVLATLAAGILCIWALRLAKSDGH